MKMQGQILQGWLDTLAGSQGILGSHEHIFMLLLPLPDESDLEKGITACALKFGMDETNSSY